MPHLYFDENFPKSIVARLYAIGHDTLTAQDDGRANRKISDVDVLARAASLGRIVITQDRDDYHHLHASGLNHAGFITTTRDSNYDAWALRIHVALMQHPDFTNRLVRIVRPSSPVKPSPSP